MSKFRSVKASKNPSIRSSTETVLWGRGDRSNTFVCPRSSRWFTPMYAARRLSDDTEGMSKPGKKRSTRTTGRPDK